jgi:hypothetical protein
MMGIHGLSTMQNSLAREVTENPPRFFPPTPNPESPEPSLIPKQFSPPKIPGLPCKRAGKMVATVSAFLTVGFSDA